MEKMDGMTMNIEQANVEKLKEVFPEVFADGKVDFDKLQMLLGNYIADDKERYSFSWKDGQPAPCTKEKHGNAPSLQGRKQELGHDGKSLHRRRQLGSVETSAVCLPKFRQNDLHRSALQHGQ